MTLMRDALAISTLGQFGRRQADTNTAGGGGESLLGRLESCDAGKAPPRGGPGGLQVGVQSALDVSSV